MTETTQKKFEEWMALEVELERAHYLATRDALLDHARHGNPINETDGKGNYWMTSPAEIFARYGFDENGKPLPESSADA